MERHKLKIDKLKEDLRRERSIIDNEGLGEVYKNVIELYNKSMKEENYLQSFILIQNLFEDRLYVLYKYVEESKNGEDSSLEHYHKSIPLWKVILKLNENHSIYDRNIKQQLSDLNTIRNRFIHFSFMKPDVYTKELSEVFYTIFRELDSEIRNFKKSL
tara:strand:+ start:108 stop:584 length:477 start_codon:yes stop_codon:yes gene_type:complete